MSKPINVALYARVSSQKQAEEETIQSQLHELRKRIAIDQQHIQAELEFCDDGYSGAELLRPQLERLRDRVALGMVDRLYILSPDRLSRRSPHLAILVEEFKQHRCEVVFLNHAGFGETAESNLLIQMQGVIAEYEREKILERTRRGRKYSAQSGNLSVFGRAPYGYTYFRQSDGQAARWEVDPIRSEHVKMIFGLVVQKRMSLSKIVSYFREQSIPTAKGKPVWDTATIRGILRNSAYYGTALFGKTQRFARENVGRPKKGMPAIPRQAKVARPRVDGEKFEIAVPAIIDRELFNEAQLIMEKNRKQQRERQVNTRYLLSGLLTCGACGSAFCARRHNNNDKYIIYRCIGADKYRRKGQDVCSATSVKGLELEDLVWTEITKLLTDPARVRQELSKRITQPNINEQQIDRLNKSVQASQERINRLIDAYETGMITKPEFESRIKHVREKLKHDQMELASAIKSLEHFNMDDAALKLETFAHTISARLATADWDLRRQICKLLIERIEISQTEIHITYKVPQNPFVLGPANGAFVQHCLSRHAIAPRFQGRHDSSAHRNPRMLRSKTVS